MAMIHEWDEVDKEFAGRERIPALRDATRAMRRLVEKIKLDQWLDDLHPSVSHASLVLRGRGPRSVWVSATEDGGYCVYLVGPKVEFLDSAAVNEDSVISVLRDYLTRARLS